MITRNEKAKGLWWRLLATLPVLAVLMIANTKVTAQEQQVNPNPPIDADTYQIVMYEYDDQDRFPVNDTVVYNEDGSYTEIKREKDIDPKTGRACTKVSLSTYDRDGNPTKGFNIKTEPNHGDTSVYHITPNEGFRFPAQVEDNDTIFNIVEEMPKFPGGEQAMMEYIAKNVKYPKDAKDKNQSGKVFVSFVVEKDGSVTEVKVLKGVCESIDNESVRVVKSMPNWKPGKQKGEPVRVSYCLPITFKLGDGQTATPVKTSDGSRVDMKPDQNDVYQIVEEMPKFPGGEQAMMEYIAKNVKYPEDAIKKNQSGRVFVSFVIEKDGSITEVKVLRSVYESLDDEAIRVVKAMPKWTPGKMKGEPVRVAYTLPIFFKL